jgi:regulator of sigma E protease
MNVLFTIGSFVIVLGVLVFVHELGHFLAAKAVGIAVLRFSLGLGPVTPLRFRKGETEYCVSWVPFGGYVKMAGLEEEGAAGKLEGPREDAQVPPERTFDHKPLWARAFVMLAGVTMNALFAVAAFTFLTWRYGKTVDTSTIVGGVNAAALPMGAAQLETLRAGDRILKINGDTMTGWLDIQMAFLSELDTPLRLEIQGRPDPVLVDVPMSASKDRAQALDALQPWHEPVIGQVVPGQQAEAAGLKSEDRVLRVNGDTVLSWEQWVGRVEAAPRDTLRVAVQRGSEVRELTVVPRAEEVPDSAGTRREVGKIGVGNFLQHTRFGLAGSFVEGFRRTGDAASLVFTTLKGLVTMRVSMKDLGGPVMIGKMSGQAARMGMETLLGFMALLSVNLAILNLLPIPVLDGGHLIFLIVETIRGGRPVSMATREKLTTVGLVFLLVLMVFVTWNDILR